MASRPVSRRLKRTLIKRSLEDTPTKDPQLMNAVEEEDEEGEIETCSTGKGGKMVLQLQSPINEEYLEDEDKDNNITLLENSENCRRFSSRMRRKTNFLNLGGEDDEEGDRGEKKMKRKKKRVPPAVRRLSFQPQQSESPSSSLVSRGEGSVDEGGGSPDTSQEEATKLQDNNNYTPPPPSPSPSPHLSSPLPADMDTVDGSDEPSYPAGSIVWGKLPRYEWWPGIIVSCSQDRSGEGRDTPEETTSDTEEEGGGGGIKVCQVWVKWCGENNLSHISVEKLAPFGSFAEYFSASSLKGVYKKAIFIAIKEAAKRCNFEFTSRSDDRTLYSVITGSSPEPTLIAGVGSGEGEGKEGEGEGKRGDDNNCSTDQPSGSMSEVAKSTKKKRRKKLAGGRTEKGRCQLTSLEHEMYEWARKGFLPSGPAGFKPTSDHNEFQVLPVQQAAVKKTGESEKTRRRRGNGRESDEEPPKKKSKVMLLQVKKKVQFNDVREGKVKIQDICIGCGGMDVIAEHPLFEGSLCKGCKDLFLECSYLFDEDGTQMYCCICSAGEEVFMCDTENCANVYCAPCVEKLCGSAELEMVKAAEGWKCYMCSCEKQSVGLLTRRPDWDRKVQELFSNNEQSYPIPTYPPIPPESRTPIRVLGLFDGIATGLLVLKELGIEIDTYIASEVDEDAIKVSCVWHNEIRHVGDIKKVAEKEIETMGPFDLVIGGSPCNDLSIVNPLRRGIFEGTGKLFFEFYRVLSHVKLCRKSDKPLFWLYENVVSMKSDDKMTISRFLQCNPIVVDAKEISATHRARYFWSNIPGMNRAITPLPGDRLTLQDCLEPNCSRKAQFLKLRTITTKMNSIKQTKKAIYPVRMGSLLGGAQEQKEEVDKDEMQGDVLWCTEMERLFGFPDHYTDVANLGRSGRQRLLGKAWSVPVMRHILSPLKDYFRSNTTLARKTPAPVAASSQNTSNQ